MTDCKNIILAGFMGTGKSAIGRVVAERLGWSFVDTDTLIEHRAGRSVAEIFSELGEPHFRSLERDLCRSLVSESRCVIASGGGMPVDPENRRRLHAAGLCICLCCDPEEVVNRIGKDRSRPLLMCDDPAERVQQLVRLRAPAYDSLLFQIDATHAAIDQSADRIVRLVRSLDGETRFLPVVLPTGSGYTIGLGPGFLSSLGQVLRDRGLTSRVAVVTDMTVESWYLQPIMESLTDAGFRPFACTVPAGEVSKTLAQAEVLYQRFVEEGLDRRGAVVALGGGVVGDLAGFAAATYMRGVALIQCPTTLLAMVDSSVGGKTGVDLPAGKNLVGAFKQAVAVVADTSTLVTLPRSEIRMGLAETIKHGIIGDAGLFEEVESAPDPTSVSPEIVARSVSVKINVVEQDPFESGLREVLNLGHTVGHALEKCSRYAMAHGDAVGVGLVAAARISTAMGLCEPSIPERIERLLTRVDLPVCHALEPADLVAVMAADKKSLEGRLRFVLIREIGKVEHGRTVEPELVKSVLEDLRAGRS